MSGAGDRGNIPSPPKKLAKIQKETKRIITRLKKSGTSQVDQIIEQIRTEFNVQDEEKIKKIRNSIAEQFVPISEVEGALQEAIEDKFDLENDKEDYIRLHERALKDKEQYEKALQEIDSIIELREIIESYELQFTLLIPEHLRPMKTHSNPAKIYESRYERWIWILTNCQEERIKVLADALNQGNALQRFCVMVASLFPSVSKRIHFPSSKKNHTSTEMVESLKNQGMLSDASLEQAVLLLVDVLPQLPDPVSEATKKLKTMIASKRGPSPNDGDKGVGDKGDGSPGSKNKKSRTS